MSDLNSLSIRAAVLRVLSDRVNGELSSVKEQITEILGPGGRKNPTFENRKLASVYVSDSGKFSISNQALFVAWVKKNYPHQVEVVERVHPSFVTLIEESSKAAGEPCGPEGELDVPGVSLGEPWATVRKAEGAMEFVEELWVRGVIELDGRIKELE